MEGWKDGRNRGRKIRAPRRNQRKAARRFVASLKSLGRSVAQPPSFKVNSALFCFCFFPFFFLTRSSSVFFFHQQRRMSAALSLTLSLCRSLTSTSLFGRLRFGFLLRFAPLRSALARLLRSFVRAAFPVFLFLLPLLLRNTHMNTHEHTWTLTHVHTRVRRQGCRVCDAAFSAGMWKVPECNLQKVFLCCVCRRCERASEWMPERVSEWASEGARIKMNVREPG